MYVLVNRRRWQRNASVGHDRGRSRSHAVRGPLKATGMRTASILFLALSLPGCGAEQRPVDSLRVRDSAGVEIASIPVADAPAWHVDSIPFVDIWTAEGVEGQDLGLPWASRRLSDGRIVISNAQTNELRFYRPDGTFITAAGGRGQGPGEFSLIAAIHLMGGDTMVVVDAQQPRLNLFDPVGRFIRTITLQPLEDRLPRLRGLIGDSVAVYRVPLYQRSGGVSSAVRDTFLVASQSLQGGPYLQIGRFPATERFNQLTPSGDVAQWPFPFACGFFTAVADGLLWIGISDSYELRAYDAAGGALERILRVDVSARPVENRDRRRFVEHQLASAEGPDQERLYREVQRILEFPVTMPAFADLKNDSEDNLWVQEFEVPWSETAPVWHVYTPRGVRRATVRLPVGLDVHDIGSDYLMGLWRDALGVEHIRAYRLQKGNS